MSFFDIIKAILPLLIILGFLSGILYLVKKYSFSLGGKKSKAFDVDVIYNHLILPKKYLSFVRLQDKVLVLGISENSISLIKEIEYSEIEEAITPRTDVKGNFIDILKQNMGIK